MSTIARVRGGCLLNRTKFRPNLTNDYINNSIMEMTRHRQQTLKIQKHNNGFNFSKNEPKKYVHILFTPRVCNELPKNSNESFSD